MMQVLSGFDHDAIVVLESVFVLEVLAVDDRPFIKAAPLQCVNASECIIPLVLPGQLGRARRRILKMRPVHRVSIFY